MKNVILQGDALTKLKELPEKSINMCMTSPPYWALRDYGTANWEGGDEKCDHKIPDGEKDPKNKNNTSHNVRFIRDVCYKCGAKRIDKQLGLEPTFEQYISNLCDIFDGVKRVLRDDGTCWVNLGDTYNAGRNGGHAGGKIAFGKIENNLEAYPKQSGVNVEGMSAKCLTMIPQRFAIEMINRGWILRNTIIWHKPNCMPCSAKDRFTVDFEYVFLFSKKKKYYFEQQLEKTITKDSNVRDRDTTKLNNTPGRTRMGGLTKNDYDLKNKRTVWRICPKPFKEAHFAVYPEELCETPIKAGCPEFVCKKCGMPKILEIEYSGGTIGKGWHDHSNDMKEGMLQSVGGLDSQGEQPYKREIKGYKPTCNCNAGFTGGIVLDPFFGAGTTGLVALKQNKNYIGIELNPEYIEIAEKRLKPFREQTSLNLNKENSNGK